MGKKVNRVPVYLDAGGVKSLPFDEIKAILRGADDLIASGGRTLLRQILKGSKRKRLLELGLDKSPVFGFYRNLSEQEIMARIDWTILRRYMRIEYDYKLPLLVYTDKGWEIEKVTYAEELLQALERASTHENEQYDVSQLKDKDRGLILLLLDKIQATGKPKFIPLLEAWAEIEYKKVQERIRGVIFRLRRSR